MIFKKEDVVAAPALKVVIVGCGKVGITVTHQLSQEGNDITIIDKNEENIADITNQYDVMGITGNGASYSVLVEAGIETADLLIAMTVSDELNLLCCVIARKASKCHTIARVRNPMYNPEHQFLQKELGLSIDRKSTRLNSSH